MTITITAFERSPWRQGLARDTRSLGAGEVGQPYDVRLVSFRAMKEPASGASSVRPDSDVWEGDLALFETGAIVLHIAERHAGLLPDDANARARDHMDVCRAQHGGAADP
jgi:glutathione S-transferase